MVLQLNPIERIKAVKSYFSIRNIYFEKSEIPTGAELCLVLFLIRINDFLSSVFDSHVHSVILYSKDTELYTIIKLTSDSHKLYGLLMCPLNECDIHPQRI